ncbi:MAG: hypothetical protein R2684_11335 [Pyrinomonadaceae bacterium]
MKNLALPCRPLLFAAILIFSITASAQTELIEDLLSLPAPTAPISYSGISPDDPEFYSYKNIPADDAPIEILLLYWARWNDADPFSTFALTPSDTTVARLLEACEKRPMLTRQFTRIFHRFPGTRERARQILKSTGNDIDVSGEDFNQKLADAADKAGEAAKAAADAVRASIGVDEDESENGIRVSNSPSRSKDRNSIEALIADAGSIKDTDEYLTNHRPLLDLSLLSPKDAKRIAQRYAEDDTNPITRTLGRWILYKLAYDANDDSEAETYRALLIETIEDKSEKPGNRDLAMDAIVNVGDFTGRDDWYFSLFEDETLFELEVNGGENTGMMTMIMFSPPDKYIDRLVELVGSKNRAVRNMAAKNLGVLLGKEDPRVVAALLPWLSNANWAKESRNERSGIVRALESVRNPASVEGLLSVLSDSISVLNELRSASPETDSETSNSNTYYDFETSNRKKDTIDLGIVISALGNQRDMRAGPALKMALPYTNGFGTAMLVDAIYLCHGYTVEEQVEAVFKTKQSENDKYGFLFQGPVGRRVSRMRNFNFSSGVEEQFLDPDSDETQEFGTVRPGVRKVYGAYVDRGGDYKPVEKELSQYLSLAIARDEHPSSDFLAAMISRVQEIKETKPMLFKDLRRTILGWKGNAVLMLYLSELSNSEVDLEAVVRLLAERKTIVEVFSSEVLALEKSKSEMAIGLLPCFFEDEVRAAAILASGTDYQKAALLGCARLIRFELPYTLSEKALASPNNMLKIAAAKYLESLETDRARISIWRAFPNEVAIVGARKFFPGTKDLADNSVLVELFKSAGLVVPSPSEDALERDYSSISSREFEILRDLKTDPDIDAIYSFGNFEIVRRGAKAVLHWWNDPARFYERELTNSEFDDFRSILEQNEFSTLKSKYSRCDECYAYELVLVNRDGGRRIFLEKPSEYGDEDNMSPTSDFAISLLKYFEELSQKSGELKYRASRNLAGLETVFHDENFFASALLQRNSETIVVVRNESKLPLMMREMISTVKASDRNWSEDLSIAKDAAGVIDQIRLSGLVFRTISAVGPGEEIKQVPKVDSRTFFRDLRVDFERESKSSLDGSVEVRSNYGYGLLIGRDGEFVEIESERFGEFEISNDGAYLLTTVENKNEKGIRILNLKTLKFRTVGGPTGLQLTPKIYIQNLGAFVACEREKSLDRISCGSASRHFLVDPVKGTVTAVDGGIDALLTNGARNLQSAGGSDVWLAIRKMDGTAIGKFSLRTYKFTETNFAPNLRFTTGQLKVFEKEGVVLVVYNGDILRFPLYKPKEDATPAKPATAATILN